MKGTKPNNRNVVVFPSPSCLRNASAIHLPARSIATSPLWLKTVTCGLFLRCFTPPRRAPEGEGLIGCVHDVISSVSREIPHGKNENNRTRYAAGRGRPALPTATPRIGHNVISSVSQEVSLREKRKQSYTNTNKIQSPLQTFPFREIPTVTSFPRNDKLYRRVRRLIRINII